MDLPNRTSRFIPGRRAFGRDFETLEGLVDIAISRLQRGEEDIFLLVGVRGTRGNYEVNYTLGTRTVKTSLNLGVKDSPRDAAYFRVKRLVGDYPITRVRNGFVISKG